MSDLDDKLREILWGASTIGAGMDDYGAMDKAEQAEQIDAAIAQIRQVFADEITPYADAMVRETQAILDNAGATKVMPNVMTGQGWYDRFEEQLYTENWDKSDTMLNNTIEVIKDCGKRAAGLS